MIINTGSRTDIPAFFSDWLLRRIKEGYVCMRNPYFPSQVTRYLLDSSVVDCLVFCTKNPEPMLERAAGLKDFGQYWFVTITPYGRDVEPYVPDKREVIRSFCRLSEIVGKSSICWRYDPVFVSDTYPAAFHVEVFEQMASALCGYTDVCVISFIDLYEKTLRNFKGVTAVDLKVRGLLLKAFVETGKKYGIRIRTCAEGTQAAQYGADTGGCLTREVLENAIGESLTVRAMGRAREACACLLGNDIGMYNTCGHGCLYCYANYDRATVERNRQLHDPESPFLVGGERPEDVVREAKQERFRNGQLKLRF